jgi:hypothetical protein
MVVKDEDEEFNEPHLPARYQEHVRKKRQRRLIKRIGLLGIAVIALVVVYSILSGIFTGAPHSSLPLTPQATTVPVSPSASSPAMTTLPAETPVKTTVPPTTTLPISTVAGTDTPEPILTARAAAITTATRTRDPTITEQQATIIALAAFPNIPAGDMIVESTADPDFGPVWEYTLRVDTTTEVKGLIDAETGEVLTFNRTIHPGGRTENPVLTLGEARKIADSTINNRNNGILSINMSSSRYIPLATAAGNIAGSSRFVYTRTVQDYPCDADGFVVSVDAVTGAITEYVQHWQTLDTAFMLAEDPLVPKFDATFAVSARAKSTYPSSIKGLRIISADIRWKDRHDPTTIPRPSTIPLAWKVVFDDETIRAKGDPTPAVGWVDTQTGEIIEFSYRH